MTGSDQRAAPGAAGGPVPDASIFKAYDIRGVVDRTLTAAAVEAIGRAIGSAALDGGDTAVIVGRDGRLSGPQLAAALQRGIRAAGCDTVDIGMVPTPLVYFATHHLGIGSAVAVTGSHNPPEYNGLKVMVAGATLHGEGVAALRLRIENGDLHSGTGALRSDDVVPAYLDRITSDIRLRRPLRVVVDCGNGVAGWVAPDLLRRLGCRVTELYCEVDGRFPNHHPDPSIPANLDELAQAVVDGGCDFGAAFDGDGDRLGVIAPDGSIVWPDRQLILFATDLLQRQPGAEILYDVKCSRRVPAAIEALGGWATMWKTGHSLIKARLRETGAALAGEMSGHLFFRERWYGFDDGLYTAARLAELLARDARPPLEIFRALPDSVCTPELRLEMPDGGHHALVRRLLAAADFADGRVSTIDGLRVDFARGFALARPSNTTPTVILRFEGDDETSLAAIQERFRALFRRVDPNLRLPF